MVRVLLAEDSQTQAMSLRLALEAEGFTVIHARDGREALDQAKRIRPDLVISDVLMPRMDGFQLCRRIRSDPALQDVPLILRTSVYGSMEDRAFAAAVGADDYIAKDVSSEEVAKLVHLMFARPPSERRRLALDEERFNERYSERVLDRLVQEVDRAERAYEELRATHDATLQALVAALDLRDTETEAHSWRVMEYSLRIADLIGDPSLDREGLRRGALLHDIGKIGVPDHILRKPSPLTDEEWVEMRKHPALGYGMLSHIALFHAAGDVILCHHERWDGAGYPAGLAGKRIPMGARIFAAADTLDAVTSHRPYRRARSFDAALSIVAEGSGTQFDADVVRAVHGLGAADWNEIKKRVENEVAARKLSKQDVPSAHRPPAAGMPAS